MSARALTAADVEAIASSVAAKIAGSRALAAKVDALLVRVGVHADPVLTPREAALLAKRPSKSAFNRWCLRWRVKPCAGRNYARATIVRALEDEAMSRGKRRADAGAKRKPTDLQPAA